MAKKKEGYIDKYEFYCQVVKYNQINIYDEGEWITKYVKKNRNKYLLGKIDQNKFVQANQFALKKWDSIQKIQKELNKFIDEEDKQKFLTKRDYEIEHLKNELAKKFMLISQGRIKKMTKKDVDEETINDIIEDSVITQFKYVSRFDFFGDTIDIKFDKTAPENEGKFIKFSVFSFFTQIAFNCIKYALIQAFQYNTYNVASIDELERLHSSDIKSAANNYFWD